MPDNRILETDKACLYAFSEDDPEPMRVAMFEYLRKKIPIVRDKRPEYLRNVKRRYGPPADGIFIDRTAIRYRRSLESAGDAACDFAAGWKAAVKAGKS